MDGSDHEHPYYAASLVKSHEVNVIDLRDYELPIFSMDTEQSEGIPENAIKLKALFDEHDGFIISLPEHNTSLTAFFKNTIEWVSRIHMSFFEHKSIALFSASPGSGGGRNALAHGEKVLSGYMTGNVVGTVFVPSFHQNVETDVNDAIKIIDSEIDKNINDVLAKLEASVAKPELSLLGCKSGYMFLINTNLLPLEWSNIIALLGPKQAYILILMNWLFVSGWPRLF